MFNIVLVEPEIPPNTGNVGRLCLATINTASRQAARLLTGRSAIAPGRPGLLERGTAAIMGFAPSMRYSGPSQRVVVIFF